MQISTQKLKDSQIKMVVELNKDDLIFYAREASKKLANSTRVDGFRPGRVPPDIVRKHVGDDIIRKEALDLAIKQSASDAIEQEKFSVIEYSDLNIKENSPEKLSYEITLAVFPEIELGPYTDLEVKTSEVRVEPEEVMKVLNEIQRSRASFEKSNEPSQKGDRVNVDFEIKADGKTIEGGASTNHPMVLEAGKFVPGFIENVIGMKSGDEKEFSVKVPKDSPQKEISGKTLEYKIKINKVEHINMPEVDDSFAKSLGRFMTMSEVEKNIEDSLMTEKKEREKEKIRLVLLEKILNKSKLEIPKVLVERQLNSMIASFDNELHQKGMELGLYLAKIGKTQDQLRQSWRPGAEKQVKMSLVAQEIAKKENIGASDEEVKNEFNLAVQQFVAGGGNIHNEEELSKLRGRIHDVLVNEKVFQFLEGHARLI